MNKNNKLLFKMLFISACKLIGVVVISGITEERLIDNDFSNLTDFFEHFQKCAAF
jgi:hypothetical protein